MHEAKQYESNCFLTLTFNDEHLPPGGSLDHSHWQLFMKRLKSAVRRRDGGDVADRIRFYMCGEYGPLLGRPHYHACVFDFDFVDKKYKRVNRVGDRIYTSEFLDKVWGQADPGMCEIGDVTFASACYVARYIMKKQTGDEAVAYYGDKKPEYTAMSRRPGIGHGWYMKNHRDVFPSDFIIHDGVRHSVPRFYGNLFELAGNDTTAIKGKRKRGAKRHKADQSDRRLKDRETVKQAQIKRLNRENDL